MVAMFSGLWGYRNLIFQMIRREVVGRYRGSVIGLTWSLLNPLLMLCVYTFVFSVVFKAKWGGAQETQGEFAVILFAGMIVFNVFSECFNRAPMLLVSNVNYVKKVVFPLEILSWVVLGNALFHAFVSLSVLLMAEAVVFGKVPLTVFLFPVVLLPFALIVMGITWFVSASGVFLRDLGQLAGVLTTVLMFTSPMFFPLSALPENIRPWLMLNPLAYFIEEARSLLIWGVLPAWEKLAIAYAAALLVAGLGYAWFQKARRGFADVL